MQQVITVQSTFIAITMMWNRKCMCVLLYLLLSFAFFYYVALNSISHIFFFTAQNE